MRLARAMRRKAERSAAVGELQAVKSYAKAKKAVRHATTREIVMQAMIRKQAAADITTTIMIAVHRTFGWGADRLTRLQKKMRVELECLKGKYVKLEELEEIIRDELKWGFNIEDASDLDMRHRTEYRTIRVMSAVLLVALRDEFGFGQKRAMRVYEELRNIWKDIHNGKTSIEDAWKEHMRISGRATVKTA